MIEKLVHEEACDLLEHLGVRCSQENLKVFEPFLKKVGDGADYDSSAGRIVFKRELIDKCLALAPNRKSFPVPERSFGGGGTAPYVYENEEWKDPHVHKHVPVVARIAQKYQVPFIFRAVGGKHCPFEDVEQIRAMREMGGYEGFIYLYVASEEGVLACKKEYLRNPNMATSHSIFYSPLAVNNVGPNYPIFFRCVEEGIPIYLVTMPLSFISAPATIYGLVMQCHAEFLAGLCLVQTLNPGLMTLHAGYPMAADPANNYQPSFGSIEHNLANISLAKVATYLNLPAIQDGCSTSDISEVLSPDTPEDVVRAYIMWNSADGWHQVRHSFGFGHYQMIFGLDRMEKDCKTLARVLDENQKIEVVELEHDKKAFDAVLEGVLAFGGSFKELVHTLKNTRVVK